MVHEAMIYFVQTQNLTEKCNTGHEIRLPFFIKSSVRSICRSSETPAQLRCTLTYKASCKVFIAVGWSRLNCLDNFRASSNKFMTFHTAMSYACRRTAKLIGILQNCERAWKGTMSPRRCVQCVQCVSMRSLHEGPLITSCYGRPVRGKLQLLWQLLFIYVFTYLCIYLFTYLCIYLVIYLFIYLFINLFI